MFTTPAGEKIPTPVFMATAFLWNPIRDKYFQTNDDKAAETIVKLENVVAKFLDKKKLQRPDGTEETVVAYAIGGV
jgi:hypothetical protein